MSAAVAAREGFIDELVAPADTRRRLAGALTALSGAGEYGNGGGNIPLCMYVASATASPRASSPVEPRWPDELARSLGGRYVNLAEVGATSEQVELEQLERALELRRTW